MKRFKITIDVQIINRNGRVVGYKRLEGRIGIEEEAFKKRRKIKV